MKTKLDRIFEMRDAQRQQRENGHIMVRGRDLPTERNRQGLQKWYMHPDMSENCLNSLVVYLQEIPPGGRTGKQQSQGGQIGIVWEGRGYSLVDGVRYDWEQHDVINLPVRTSGIVVQHFNHDKKAPAKVLFCEPNMFDALGIDRGCGFEQLEDAPD